MQQMNYKWEFKSWHPQWKNTSSGACLEQHLGILSTMYSNPRCQMNLWCRFIFPPASYLFCPDCSWGSSMTLTTDPESSSFIGSHNIFGSHVTLGLIAKIVSLYVQTFPWTSTINLVFFHINIYCQSNSKDCYIALRLMPYFGWRKASKHSFFGPSDHPDRKVS